MKFFGLSALVFTIFAISAIRGGLITEIEEEQLNWYVKNKNVLIIEACGNNHPECKTWAPEYKKAAQKAKDAKKPYTFVKINILQNPGITKTLSASKFPALRLFVNGILIPYSGNNTAEALLAFMENKTGPQSTLLSTPEEFQAVLTKKGLRVSN